MPKKPASSDDELNGPLFRVHVLVVTSKPTRNGEWIEDSPVSATEFTVVKRGHSIDLQSRKPQRAPAVNPQPQETAVKSADVKDESKGESNQ